MSNASVVSSRKLARRAALSLSAVALLLAPARTTTAQATTSARTWEFRVASGSLVPTGAAKDVIKSADLTAAQLSWMPRRSLAISATFGWARSRDLGSVNTPKLDVFMSDVGVELRTAQWFAGRKVTFSPFGGVGAGVRSYNYRSIDANATHNVSGYGALGGEIAAGRVGLRLEARNYMSGFKPLVGAGTSDTHNDIVYLVALRYSRHGAAQR